MALLSSNEKGSSRLRSTARLDYNKMSPFGSIIYIYLYIYLHAELTGQWSFTKTAQIQRKTPKIRDKSEAKLKRNEKSITMCLFESENDIERKEKD